ncbi:MAG: BON domain-containing protein [Candidatus Binatia bacterium]
MKRKNILGSATLAVSLSLALAAFAGAQSQREHSLSPSPSSPPAAGGATMQSSEPDVLGAEDKGATPADERLNQRIRQALSRDPILATAAREVQLDTENGVVTLRGSIATDTQKASMAATVQQIAGVKEVDNQLLIAVRS